MTVKPSDYVCANCGVSVGYWHFGWKHQNGRNSGLKSCKGPIKPMLRAEYNRQIDAALAAMKGKSHG